MALISYQLKTMNIFRQQSRQQSDRTMVINVRIFVTQLDYCTIMTVEYKIGVRFEQTHTAKIAEINSYYYKLSHFSSLS